MSEAKKDDSELSALLCDDGWHCDPSCPNLKYSTTDNNNASCSKMDIELVWYDFYIADCAISEDA